MPDHVHLLLTPLSTDKGWPHAMPAILKSIKGTSARSVNKLMGLSGPVWQEESFDHVLRPDESFQDKFEYIRQNPVRKGWWRGRKTIPGYGCHENKCRTTLLYLNSKAADKSVHPT